MINSPTTAVAERLFAETQGPLVSLYMPTHRAGADIWQDPIRFKNLLRAAQHDLETTGVSQHEMDSLLRPLHELQANHDFWQHQGDGLAIFRSSTHLEECRLSAPAPELCVVGSQFHLKPLLMSLADQQTFLVLALSQSQVHLFRGSPDSLTEIPDIQFAQGVAKKDGHGKSLQSHSAGAAASIPHASELDQKAQVRDYCRRIDQALAPIASDQLVILAAVDYVATLYRESSSLRMLAPKTISGNPDESSPSQLLKKALPIANAHFERSRLLAEEDFFNCLGRGRALDEPSAVMRAAREGRIETLFVPIGVQIWGRIDDDDEIRLSDHQGPADQDLLNAALIETWKNRGRVFAVVPEKMPGGRIIAATTRF